MSTACRDCVHLLDLGPLPYEKQCELAPVMHFNPFTGITSQVGFVEIAKVNLGDCPNFEVRPEAVSEHV